MVKFLTRIFFYLLTAFVGVLAISNLVVIISTYSRIFESVENVPKQEVGLVLGTSRRLSTGDDNPFFYNRIKTAAELSQNDKIDSFLLSGDSTSRYYNEPSDMKKALMDLGIPDSVIRLDYSGLSTYESMKRCRDVYGITSITVITQRFHGYRAVYLGDHFDISSNAVVTEEVPIGRSFRTLVRELFARTKAVGDVYIQ